MATTLKRPLIHGLSTLLSVAGQESRSWITSAVIGSAALAILDTMGVAAMVPLMELLTGADTATGVLGLVSGLTGATDRAALIPVVAGSVALLFVLKSALTILFRWWLLGRTMLVSANAATEMLRRYVLSPYVVHRKRQLSETYRNINDATGQASSVLLGVVGILSDLLMLAAITVVLVVSSPTAMLVSAAFFGTLMWATQALLHRRQTQIGEELSEGALQTWQFLLPALDGFREARLTLSATSFVVGFADAKRRMAHSLRMLSIVSEIPKYLLEIAFIITVIGISLILFATAPPAAALTSLGVFAAASLRALPTLNRVTATFAIIRSGQAGLRILTRAAAELDGDGRFDETPLSQKHMSGDIVISNMTFRYPDANRDTLRNVSTVIPERQTTAFVGSSGAGKSTLLDLVLGLLEPTEGEIRCGDLQISHDTAAWYSGLGVVPQDVFLLNSTLEANIAFGIPAGAVDHEQIREVIGLAQLEELVDQLPDGLSTIVGERGVRMSGGQRQRIGLARALYRRPGILVLDEATSALDNETEHQITSTLRRLRGRMTVIVVAHRLSTVRDADKLVFLRDGIIEGEGTFDEVRDSSPSFAHLVALGEVS